MTISRREFLAAAAGTVALSRTLSPGAAVAADDSQMLPIVDTHQHLWDLTRFRPPWLKDAPAVLGKSYVMADFVAATAGLNVVKAVYMEVDVDPAQQLEEAEYITELARSKRHPTVAAVISGRPNSNDFAAYITRFRNSPYIKGVRQVLHNESIPRGLCLETQFVKSIQLLGELGMSFDLCMRPTELSDGLKLAQQCPGTRFIVDHCGNADPHAFLPAEKRGPEKPWHEAEAWKRDLGALAATKNVICKISGIVARAPQGWEAAHLAPIINHCLSEFGPDRVIFGGDWPVCLLGASYRQWVEALKAVIHDRSETEHRKLLHDNAVKFYGLT